MSTVLTKHDQPKILEAMESYKESPYTADVDITSRTLRIVRRSDSAIVLRKEFPMRMWQENVASFMYGFLAGSRQS